MMTHSSPASSQSTGRRLLRPRSDQNSSVAERMPALCPRSSGFEKVPATSSFIRVTFRPETSPEANAAMAMISTARKNTIRRCVASLRTR